jgi:hypothetical protein
MSAVLFVCFVSIHFHSVFTFPAWIHSPNTLALTPFPLRIGSTCGFGLFLEREDELCPITHRNVLLLEWAWWSISSGQQTFIYRCLALGINSCICSDSRFYFQINS